MGVHIFGSEKNKRYRLVPEKVSNEEVSLAKDNVSDARKFNRGFSKEGAMKLVGEIPESVLYNYFATNKIPWEKKHDWMKTGGYKKFFQEFPMFKV